MERSSEDFKREQEFFFHNLAIADFQEAAGCLETMKRFEKGLVRSTLIKNAIIAYARPFMVCKGNCTKHHLSEKVVPKGSKRLHGQVLKWRNEIIAHTDLTFRKPRLVEYGMVREMEPDYEASWDSLKELVARVWSAVHNMVIKYRRE